MLHYHFIMHEVIMQLKFAFQLAQVGLFLKRIVDLFSKYTPEQVDVLCGSKRQCGTGLLQDPQFSCS